MVAAFADVLNWIKGIPDVEEAERVTEWVKEKYRIENQLEGKVERLEKTMANRDFQIKTMSEELLNNRNLMNQMKDSWCEMEQKEQYSMAKIQALEKRSAFYEDIIRTMDEKRAKEQAELARASNSAGETSAAVSLGRGLDAMAQQLSEVTQELQETKDAKEKLQKNMVSSNENDSEWSSQLEALRKEYEEKMQLERQNHEAAYEKLLESKNKASRWGEGLKKRYYDLVEEISKERAERNKTIAMIEKALYGAEAHLMERMTRILNLEEKCKTLTGTVEQKEARIQELTASERDQCEQRMVSQDKLVAQMEKTLELQEEVKKMTIRIQNLGLEEISSDEDEAEESHVEVSAVEEASGSEEDHYSSDSSFDPIDDDDLYN